MPTPSRPPHSRPHSTPAYYLARPATWWITALHRQPHQHVTDRAPDGSASSRPAATA